MSFQLIFHGNARYDILKIKYIYIDEELLYFQKNSNILITSAK